MKRRYQEEYLNAQKKKSAGRIVPLKEGLETKLVEYNEEISRHIGQLHYFGIELIYSTFVEKFVLGFRN
jgi:hypothetical protein